MVKSQSPPGFRASLLDQEDSNTAGGKGGPNGWTEEDLVEASLLRRPPLYYSTLNVESVSTGLKPKDTRFTLHLTFYL